MNVIKGSPLFKHQVLKCSCCENEFKIENKTTYKWKLGKEYYCSYKCYSKVFDSKYQASSITTNYRLSYSRGKVVDRGYERHGSR